MEDGLGVPFQILEIYFGSLQNEECKIDSISQSWAVISSAGDNDKKYIAMESLENHLIDTENGIEGIAKIARSNKLTPEIITNYTRVVFKDRLEVIFGTEKKEVYDDLQEKEIMEG